MDFSEAQAQKQKAEKLIGAYEALSRAKRDLDLVNKYVKSGLVWRPRLNLQRDKFNSVDIEVKIPVSIVQQQVVDAYKRAKRHVILLGGKVE